MSLGCKSCRDGVDFNVPFSMVFQPIFDLASGAIFAREALVRGVYGEGAQTILSQVDDTNRYAFDQQCRIKAIEMAADRRDFGDRFGLSINFMPNAVYEPRACIRLTLDAARRTGFPLNQIIFEFTETERLDTKHLLHILGTYREIGFKTAIDDFGAGYAGLGLLTRFQPDIVTLAMLEEMGIAPICEGIETTAELATVQDLGVRLLQGYALGRPVFESPIVEAESTRDTKMPLAAA